MNQNKTDTNESAWSQAKRDYLDHQTQEEFNKPVGDKEPITDPKINQETN